MAQSDVAHNIREFSMKVTVLVITYNHEKFIGQAIESVLMQETDFDYEVVIVEDCSTDRTRHIVVDLQKKYPDRIRLVLAEKNPNYKRACKEEILKARGRYIALLDGDDYWTSPLKLQKQVDFLDVHSECAVCFHNTTIVYEDNSEKPRNSNHPEQKRISTLDDLWGGCFMNTCSVMFRAGLFETFPSWFDSVFGDWALHILNAQHGKIGYIDEIMAVYRRHSGGAWNGLSKIKQILIIIKIYDEMNINLHFRYNESIKHFREQIGGELLEAIRVACRAGNWREILHGMMGLGYYFPEHMLTELRPNYRPLPLRRYPIVHRVLNRWRHFLRLYAERQNQANYEGFVDTADCNVISGWAWDSTRPTSPIDIEIWDGRNLLSKPHADRFRRDLLDTGKGNGYHAFNCQLPAQYREGNYGPIRVKVAGGNFALSPVSNALKCESATE